MVGDEKMKMRLIEGNTLQVLKTLPSESVDCVITSPPYWGLRDYGSETEVIWDSKESCEHEWQLTKEKDPMDRGGYGDHDDGGIAKSWEKRKEIESGFCSKCGAWKGQLGLEPTLELYLKHLLEITAELKRILKKTGTMFWNHGDSYGGSGCGTNDYRTEASKSIQGTGKNAQLYKTGGIAQKIDYPQKCLLMQNFRLAQKMIDEQGWILRNVLIWWKPNCMPASVKDRFTVDYEPIFFFVKCKRYFFEMQYEPHLTQENRPDGIVRERTFGYNTEYPQIRGFKIKKKDIQPQLPQHHGQSINYSPQGRNKRCVWRITNQPFKEAHFAVFPEKLIEPMIRSGCPEFICSKCGRVREKIYEKNLVVDRYTKDNGKVKEVLESNDKRMVLPRARTGIDGHNEFTFIGFSDCECNAGFEGGIVLDPFLGSGTTMVVARRLGRSATGIELNPRYVQICKKRLK